MWYVCVCNRKPNAVRVWIDYREPFGPWFNTRRSYLFVASINEIIWQVRFSVWFEREPGKVNGHFMRNRRLERDKATHWLFMAVTAAAPVNFQSNLCQFSKNVRKGNDDKFSASKRARMRMEYNFNTPSDIFRVDAPRFVKRFRCNTAQQMRRSLWSVSTIIFFLVTLCLFLTCRATNRQIRNKLKRTPRDVTSIDGRKQ